MRREGGREVGSEGDIYNDSVGVSLMQNGSGGNAMRQNWTTRNEREPPNGIRRASGFIRIKEGNKASKSQMSVKRLWNDHKADFK